MLASVKLNYRPLGLQTDNLPIYNKPHLWFSGVYCSEETKAEVQLYSSQKVFIENIEHFLFVFVNGLEPTVRGIVVSPISTLVLV